jgi:hypothetical protein
MSYKTEEFDFRLGAAEILADAERAAGRARDAEESARGGAAGAARGAGDARARLAALYGVVVQCIEERRLDPIVAHAESAARQCFEAGLDVREVQCAMNVLEEAIWRRIMTGVPPEELGVDIGLVSTVLGRAKDALAREYISLASHHHVDSLNQDALFEPRGSGPDAEWQ